MIKIRRYAVCFILFLNLVMGLIIFEVSGRQRVVINQLNRTIIQMDIQDNHEELIKEIIEEEAFKVFSSHEYKIHKFDCTDFSKELASNLRNKGFNAYCVFGILKGASYPLHTWVEVKIYDSFIWVESTNGEIVEEENKDNYKLLSKTKVCI